MNDLNAGHCQHLLAELTVVGLVVDDSLDASLDDHLCAQLARETCRVERRAHGPLSASLHDRRLLSVETQTLV